MILHLIGKINTVDYIELIDSRKEKLQLTKVKIFDQTHKTIETVQLPYTEYKNLIGKEGKYIVLPFHFIQYHEQACLGVSEHYSYIILDHSPLGNSM